MLLASTAGHLAHLNSLEESNRIPVCFYKLAWHVSVWISVFSIRIQLLQVTSRWCYSPNLDILKAEYPILLYRTSNTNHIDRIYD